MIDRRKLITAIIGISLFVMLVGCGAKAPQPTADPSAPAGNNTHENSGPYVSITYGCNNPDNFTGRDMVFYTYDLTEKQLVKAGTIPFDAKYATGVVSKAANTIYYARRLEPKTIAANDCLCAYDIASGVTTVLEAENFSYNEISLVDPETLLVMAVTQQHPIIPARFDLESRTFTYISDANEEPLSRYTNGDSLLHYDYNTGTFVSVFQNEAEKYSSDYRSFQAEIGTYIAVVSNNLIKDEDKIFKIDLRLGSFIDDAVQLSENQLLVERTDDRWDDETEDIVSDRIFYLLTFEGNGTATLKQTEAPFPLEGVRRHGYGTPDGGKTWFLISGEKAARAGGLYVYSTETEELAPVLLNDPDNEGYVINFSFIGPQ